MEPPKKPLKFLRWFCREDYLEEIEGDLTELFRKNYSLSPRSANWSFTWRVMTYFRPEFIKSFSNVSQNSHDMYKSYLKIGWRNLRSNKGYSAINVGGLAIGMAVFILIAFWIRDEVTYDKNFTNYDRIARVVQNQTFDGTIQTSFSQALQLGPELKNTYGNHFEHVVMSSFPNDIKLEVGTKKIVKSGSFMEPGITDMLTLKMISGTRGGLENMNSILLSASSARALFGSDDALDKLIRVDNRYDVKVSGVYEDLPENSSFSNLKAILPWQLLMQLEGFDKKLTWGNSWFQLFVQLQPGAEMADVSMAIKDAKLKRVLVEDDDAKFKPELFLHPMRNWRLYSDFENGVSIGGGIKYVRMLGTIGAVVLLLACINFMNLSTARSEKRAKEVGIRKSIGSVRQQLINQFFTESMLVALMAVIISLLIVQLALPWFNTVSGKHLSILWTSPLFWLTCFGFALFTGLIAGSYPALFLSSLQPVKVLKGTFKVGRSASLPRQVLVVIQFTVSVTLVISTVVIFSQIRFAQNRPIGYAINGCVSVPVKDQSVIKHYEPLRDELLKTGLVSGVSASEGSITNMGTTNSGFTWAGKDPGVAEEFVTMGINHSFGKVIGWDIIQGRDFSEEVVTDSTGFVVNEAALELMGLKNPVGEVVKWGRNGEWKIIGVVKNMITQSPYAAVRPMIFFLRSSKLSFIRFNLINLRLNPTAGPDEAISAIAPIFRKYDPENSFDYMFADQEFGKKFSEEKRIGELSFVFTLVATLISCLGLFGLASFMAEQRTKEIGIRKVIGATILDLWRMLSMDFIILVVLASIISIPIAYYFMESWLNGYEYRTQISWWIFFLTGAGAIAITLLTVSYQAIRAARMNPVRSLRSE